MFCCKSPITSLPALFSPFWGKCKKNNLKKNSSLSKFRKIPYELKDGVLYGFVALILSFVLRIGGIGVFPPEVAIEKFFAIVPASIQEAGIQSLGEFAKYAGLIVAIIIALIVYGIFGILYKSILPKMAFLEETFEKGILFSLIPTLFFGLVVLPVSNVGLFGLSSEAGLLSSAINLFLSNLVFGALLGITAASRMKSQIEPPPPPVSTVKEPATPVSVKRTPKKFSAQRRVFIEEVGVVLAAVGFVGLSLERYLTNSVTPLTSSPSGSGQILLNNGNSLPQIFYDPRLSELLKNEVTPVSNFYYVSKNFFDPQIDITNWSLEINGDVLNPLKFTYDEIIGMNSVEQYTTFECVSNQINGNLISNGLWTGVPLGTLLQRVGLGQNSKYVVFYSADGYSVEIPLSKALQSDSLLAYKLNRVELTVPHGYPIRAVIPGLYGMMSAKWITQIQVVDSPYQGYWQSRGWTDIGTINTLAFITFPASNTVSRASDGSVIVGGVAFAGTRGISKVEVSLDNGKTWQETTLKPAISSETWTLWAYKFFPEPGGITVIARATDGTGETQSSLYQPPFPNGAQGYASVFLTVN
jgi:DMSO/TMAO reductase YedYZ molybdopterin-dependent catalytic subunit